MALSSKKLRYWWWFFLEFSKKHLRLILLSFLLSFFLIISLVTFSPYIKSFLLSQKQVIGLIGQPDITSLPSEITNKISYGLVFLNDKGEVQPAIASSWEASKDEKTFTVHIKRNLLWDDGKEFTTQDIKDDPSYQFKDVEEKVIDPFTLRFTLKKSLAIFPTFLTRPIIRYPLHGVVGLYKTDHIKSKFGQISELALTPNKKELPYIMYRFYDSESKLIDAYKRGEITQMKLNKKSVADTFSSWKNTSIVKSVDYTQVLTLFINLNNQLLSDKEMRKAIALSIPRDSLKDAGEAADGPIAPTSWAYNTNLKRTFYDPDTATSIFKKTLVGSASQTKLNFKTSYEYFDVASIIANNLQKVGLKVNVDLNAFEKPGDFDLLLAYWKIPEDPDQYPLWHSTQTQTNFTNYKNVKVDKLLEDGRTSIKPNERKANYLDFQKVIIDDTPAIFLYYPYVYTVKRK